MRSRGGAGLVPKLFRRPGAGLAQHGDPAPPGVHRREPAEQGTVRGSARSSRADASSGRLRAPVDMPLVSVWQDAHNRSLAAPPLVEGRVDVVVVGGGITGVTTALLLGRAGKRVLLVEARYVGAGTTGRSTAKVEPAAGHPAEPDLATALGGRRPPVRRPPTPRARPGWRGSARSTASRPRCVRPTPTPPRRTDERLPGASSRSPSRQACPSAGSPSRSSRSPSRARSGSATSCRSTRMDLLETLALEAAAHGVRIVEGARVQKVRGKGAVPGRDRCRDGHCGDGRDRDQPADAGPWRLLRPAQASALLRPRVPHPGAGGQRDVPVRGPDEPVAARRRPRRRADAAGRRGGPHHRSRRATSRRLDSLRDWTARALPERDRDACLVRPGLHARPCAAGGRPAAAGPGRDPGRRRVLQVGHDQRGRRGPGALEPAARRTHWTGPMRWRHGAGTSSAACRPAPGPTPRSGWS